MEYFNADVSDNGSDGWKGNNNSLLRENFKAVYMRKMEFLDVRKAFLMLFVYCLNKARELLMEAREGEFLLAPACRVIQFMPSCSGSEDIPTPLREK